MKYAPRVYQKRAIRALVAESHFGLLLKPGLGKTSITLAALRILLRGGFVERGLVIAPLRVCYEVWPMEIEKWDEFRFINWRILHGKTKNLDDLDDVQICMINHEGLPWLFGELTKSRKFPFDWLVIDESTRFKKTNTVRFKILRNWLPRFARRTILTGTPTPNGIIDIFGQIYCVDLGKSLGRFITHFRNEFFDATGYGGYTYVPKPGAETRILNRINPITLSMTQEDWLEMPTLISNVIKVKLPEAARRVYDRTEQQLLLTLGDQTAVVPTVAAAITKCRQITAGGVYLNGGVREIHEAKIDALESIVEELDGAPLLVVYEFKHELDRMRERLGDVPALHGDMRPAEVSAIIRAWNTGMIPILAAQPQTTATGLNLQDAGSTIAWLSETWDAEIYEQLVNRIWRSGQKSNRVVVHHIIAEDTIDEVIHQVVTEKQKDQRAFVKALKGRLSTRH